METNICSVLAVFPVPDMERTARYYCDVLGFRAVPYLTVQEPHVCLYRDQVEIVLTGANRGRTVDRVISGYALEDIDGRWLAFGMKQG